jgi:hypothetical protein
LHIPPGIVQSDAFENPLLEPLVIRLPGMALYPAGDSDLTEEDLKILRGEIPIPSQ